uniref:Uncharacterized protein n=1 Tax=Peronospora matthiolae TaxID=2874970 RepID=A0AAV1TMK0_9STRA
MHVEYVQVDFHTGLKRIAEENDNALKHRTYDPILAILEVGFCNHLKLIIVVDQRGQRCNFYHSSSMLPLRWKLLCDHGNVGLASGQVTVPEGVVVKHKTQDPNTSSNDSRFRGTKLWGLKMRAATCFT